VRESVRYLGLSLLMVGLILAGGERGSAAAGPVPVREPVTVEVAKLLPEMEIGVFPGRRGVELVYGWRRPSAPVRATVVIVNGRNETFVKYREIIAFLVEAGFAVYAYDHRGQGFSGRLLADREKGHVEDFDDYAADLEYFLAHIVKAEPRRCFILAHSMGGTITLLHQLRFPDRVKALALCSPMLGFSTSPWPAFLVPPLLAMMETLGYGRDYILGGGPFQPEPYTPDNDLTSDRAHYEAYQRLIREHPRLRLGAPTNHWVGCALAAMAEIQAAAGRIRVPILLLQAGLDRVVDNRAEKRFCRNCPSCRFEVLAGSAHEIRMEKPAITAAALKSIREFFCQPTTAQVTPEN
jgi:lysophospholipase